MAEPRREEGMHPVAVGGGDDSINGGAGNDTIHGSVANDTLIGGPGRDRIYGSDGDDAIFTRDRFVVRFCLSPSTPPSSATARWPGRQHRRRLEQ